MLQLSMCGVGGGGGVSHCSSRSNWIYSFWYRSSCILRLTNRNDSCIWLKLSKHQWERSSQQSRTEHCCFFLHKTDRNNFPKEDCLNPNYEHIRIIFYNKWLHVSYAFKISSLFLVNQYKYETSSYQSFPLVSLAEQARISTISLISTCCDRLLLTLPIRCANLMTPLMKSISSTETKAIHFLFSLEESDQE